jgi:hypothetical protein
MSRESKEIISSSSAHFPYEMGWTLSAHFSFEMGWT